MEQTQKNIKKILVIVIILIIAILLKSKNIKSLATDSNITNNLEQTFTLYNQDGKTYEPIEGTKFIITNLEGKNVVDIYGKIIGELETINGTDYYVVTTDSNGQIKANLPKGLYKAIKIYVKESYILEEDEESRTYYFEIKTTTIDIPEWLNGVSSYSWNNIKSTITNKNGEVLAVGSISEYLPELAEDYYNGVDLNSDGTIDAISNGYNDGIIISYNETGQYLWSKTFGGIDEDCCNNIIQTTDGGYVIVGYTSSPILYLEGKIISELSKSNYNLKNKDGFILKITEKGEYEWGIRIGGTLDDEIIKVIQTKDEQICIVGNFTSKTCNFYENESNYVIVENMQNKGEQSSFIASYSKNGKYNWSNKIGGLGYTKIYSITSLEDSLAIIANYVGTINIDSNNTLTSNSQEYQNSIIINYSLSGTFNWYYDAYNVSPTGVYKRFMYMQFTEIATTKENNLIISSVFTDKVQGKKSGENEYNTIYNNQEQGMDGCVFILSSQGDFIKNIYDLRAKTGLSSLSDATVMFKDLKITNNNEILLGGYYYSAKNIDVDKDGSEQGEYDFKYSSQNKSSGFVIKLDLEGNVNFSDYISRNDRLLNSNSSINSVSYINNKKIVAAGNFLDQSTTTKNFYNQYLNEEEYEKYYAKKIGNLASFIFMQNIGSDYIELLQPTNITVNNTKKTYKITTQVIPNIETTEGQEKEVKGGTITGIYNQTIDGVQYTEDSIHYVETVSYGESSQEDIIITPNEGYKIQKIIINNEEYTDFTLNEEESVTLPKFTNVTNNIHIDVTFTKKIFNLSNLPITGAYSIIITDLVGAILIIIGIIKLKNKGKNIKAKK